MDNSWLQIASVFIGNAALILWFRSESRNDWRHMDVKHDLFVSKIDSNIQAIRDDSKENHRQCMDIILAIKEDIKDFHGRLCAIEEKNKMK